MKAKDAHSLFREKVKSGFDTTDALIEIFLMFYRELRSRVQGKKMKRSTAEYIVREISGKWDAFLVKAGIEKTQTFSFEELTRSQATEFMSDIDATRRALRKISGLR